MRVGKTAVIAQRDQHVGVKTGRGAQIVVIASVWVGRHRYGHASDLAHIGKGSKIARKLDLMACGVRAVEHSRLVRINELYGNSFAAKRGKVFELCKILDLLIGKNLFKR